MFFSAWDYRNFFTGVYQAAPETLPGPALFPGTPYPSLSLKSCIKQLLGHGKIGFWAYENIGFGREKTAYLPGENSLLGGRKQSIYPGKTAYFPFCLRLGQNLPLAKVKSAISIGLHCSQTRQFFLLTKSLKINTGKYIFNYRVL